MQGSSVSTGPGPTNLFVWTVSAHVDIAMMNTSLSGPPVGAQVDIAMMNTSPSGPPPIHRTEGAGRARKSTDSPDKQIRWPGPGRDGSPLHVYMRIFSINPFVGWCVSGRPTNKQKDDTNYDAHFLLLVRVSV